MTAVEEVSTNALVEKLTPREFEVPKELTEGKSNKRSPAMWISRTPRSNCMSKRFNVKWGQPTGPKRL
jgi:FixJ family two-component response regulator